MKILIAGGRDFDISSVMQIAMKYTLDEYCIDKTDITVISGCCEGADKLGELWADMFDYPVKRFPADWNKYGKSAGPIRNEQMAIACDRAVIFWNGKSKGTLNMINNLKKHNKPFTIIDY